VAKRAIDTPMREAILTPQGLKHLHKEMVRRRRKGEPQATRRRKEKR